MLSFKGLTEQTECNLVGGLVGSGPCTTWIYNISGCLKRAKTNQTPQELQETKARDDGMHASMT